MHSEQLHLNISKIGRNAESCCVASHLWPKSCFDEPLEIILLFNWEWYFVRRKRDLAKLKTVSIFLPALGKKSRDIG